MEASESAIRGGRRRKLAFGSAIRWKAIGGNRRLEGAAKTHLNRQLEVSWANFTTLLIHFDVTLDSCLAYENDFGSL